jgi:hypothetical protein
MKITELMWSGFVLLGLAACSAQSQSQPSSYITCVQSDARLVIASRAGGGVNIDCKQPDQAGVN